ncbi:MAG: class I SAM-dependent methyltransferase [Planctomycetes bacterium]|nr:class I SAM-dependent methyltransferase [Planctomycetota bacterium]MBI3848088.1 class I SAM-dependent methyltransferase [Planctomycetota bacterium]
MDFRDLQQHWNAFGAKDPMWAILTDPAKKGRKWDVDEFFWSGDFDIQCVVEYARHLGVDVARRTALDFGCGLGRLTQALCRHFQSVHGVDIAPTMIEQARRLSRNGSRCTYRNASLRAGPVPGRRRVVSGSRVGGASPPRHGPEFEGTPGATLDAQVGTAEDTDPRGAVRTDDGNVRHPEGRGRGAVRVEWRHDRRRATGAIRRPELDRLPLLCAEEVSERRRQGRARFLAVR